ncbi:beta-lactamase family protein [Streptomyces sp. ISL-22]|uniref:serine hydrolase domain-containing protein n=1 Tax=unclassified Streptomyces TaxID=2593676 RepID=UPI001BECB236|nr:MULTISPECIES: serine hydrolase domain-containing protein [unclassified Streptomyces]MBT2423431.1 beta-lactamase family protein [Streptomyces sp. ISL-24]MBT2438426.1 beta-lactamase family protein [Streptomyces sp. ISL-22]
MPTTDLRPQSLLRAITNEAGRNGSAAVMITRDGYHHTWCTGFASLAQRTPTTQRTPFEIGSITKTFTALLFAVLVEEGAMSLHEPLAAHVPPGAMPRDPRAKNITALHLATHTSGLPHLTPALILKALPTYVTNPYIRYHDRDLIKDLSRARLRFPPGTSSHYSNIGFALLGRMLEDVTKQSYADLVAEKVAGPLRLADTTARSDRIQAEGYWHGYPTPPLQTPGCAGAAAVRSSALDLTRYLTQHISPGHGLSPPLRRALQTVTHTRSQMTHTLAWHKRATDHGDLYIHPGSTRGATAFIGFSPAQRTTLVALASSGWTLRNSLIQNSYLLLRHYTGLEGPRHSRCR